MNILHSRNFLPGLNNVDLDFCENCIYGKQKRVKFLRVGKEKKSEKLELVHTDVWGPAQVSYLGGSFYYVTFIDDATRIRISCRKRNRKMKTKNTHCLMRP